MFHMCTASFIRVMIVEAVHIFKTLVCFNETAWCYVPESCHLHVWHLSVLCVVSVVFWKLVHLFHILNVRVHGMHLCMCEFLVLNVFSCSVLHVLEIPSFNPGSGTGYCG
jgi:hypothetical protein